ncbi:MAG: hypothetical protein ACLUSP_05125 [Christensenellales bacterium]
MIFDTDVDRAAVVDSAGKEINRNALIALISAIILKEQKGATIVTDSVTSDGLKEFIESHSAFITVSDAVTKTSSTRRYGFAARG